MVILVSDVAEFMLIELRASRGRDDRDGDESGPGAVIEEGVPAKALSAKHRVPFRNLKKTAPLGCRRGMDEDLAGLAIWPDASFVSTGRTA